MIDAIGNLCASAPAAILPQHLHGSEKRVLPGNGMSQMNGRETVLNPFNYNDFTTQEVCRQCWKISANPHT